MINMKKHIVFIFIFVFIFSAAPAKAPGEGHNFSVAEKIKSFMLVNNPDVQETLTEVNKTRVEAVSDSNIDYKQHGFYVKLLR